MITYSKSLDTEKALKDKRSKKKKGDKDPVKREKSADLPQQDNNHNVLTDKDKPPEYNLLTPTLTTTPAMNLTAPPATPMSRVPSIRAKSNWLKAGVAATRPVDDRTLPMIDMSMPTSPASIVPASRKGSGTMWDNAMHVAGVQQKPSRER